MTLEHQAHMTNFTVSVGQQFRRAFATGTLKSSKASLDRGIGQLVDYMLFVDEAPLQDPVKGVSTFTATFPLRGPRDTHGRALRDFDLQKRLFRYPLSYMIYSDIFETLPAAARDRIYRRLDEVLSGKDQSPKYAHRSADNCRAISEILRETKPGVHM